MARSMKEVLSEGLSRAKQAVTSVDPEGSGPLSGVAKVAQMTAGAVKAADKGIKTAVASAADSTIGPVADAYASLQKKAVKTK